MKKILSIILCLVLILSVTAALPFGAAENEDIADTSVEPTDIVSISAGTTMSAAVRADGSLWTWGCKNLEKSGMYMWNSYHYDVRKECLGIASGEYIEGTPMLAFNGDTKSVECGSQSATKFGGGVAEFMVH